jgi:hypothetical protein
VQQSRPIYHSLTTRQACRQMRKRPWSEERARTANTITPETWRQNRFSNNNSNTWTNKMIRSMKFSELRPSFNRRHKTSAQRQNSKTKCSTKQRQT